MLINNNDFVVIWWELKAYIEKEPLGMEISEFLEFNSDLAMHIHKMPFIP